MGRSAARRSLTRVEVAETTPEPVATTTTKPSKTQRPAEKPQPKRPAKRAVAKAPDARKPPRAAKAKASSVAPKPITAKPKPKAAPKPVRKPTAKRDATSAAPEARAEPQPKPEASEHGSADPQSPEGTPHPFLTPQVEAFALNMARMWEQSGRAMAAYMRPREARPETAAGNEEVADMVRTLGQVAERWISDPQRVAEAQRSFTGGFMELWANTLKRFNGEDAEPVVTADPRDGRFRDPEWTEHPVFDFLKQAYLHSSRWADRMVDDAEDLDPHTRRKASFYVKLVSNALSPSNFVMTSPELLRETLSSNGENLARGLKMLADDIDGNGELRIRQTDRTEFEVGRNLANTPGKVVYRNELFELLQYAPTTETVRARPLVIVPPWINKYYVLDLTPEKSLIRWAVEQGLTVFCISWVNPDERHAAKDFDDYMTDGIMRAIDVAREICGVEKVDAAGYCVGGTLLSITLAYMAATGRDTVASATLLTAQVDFRHAGDLMVFVDEEQIAAVEARMAKAGFLEGARMSNAFNMLRSNDLIWPYVVNTYLKGKSPFPFDLLYWNSDATRMPAANHSFYLRRCYLKNDLGLGRMEILGVPLDVGKVAVPVYSVATKEDHIAPAKSVFLGAQMFGGPVRFVLAGSGHIAGVVNPPTRKKYQHWLGPAPTGELSDWVEAATETLGSWWPDWRQWLAELDEEVVAARIPGDGPYPALEDAPGGYVKVKV